MAALRSSATARMATASASSKPRVLALHGFRTSANILKQQVAIARLTQLFSELMDITYVNAPHSASGPAFPDVQQVFQPPFYEWWDAVQDPHSQEWQYRNAEASLDWLHEYMRQNGPFDGLMGFSQGASLASTIAVMQEHQLLPPDVQAPRFMIMIAGSRNRDNRYSALYPSSTSTTPARGAPQHHQHHHHQHQTSGSPSPGRATGHTAAAAGPAAAAPAHGASYSATQGPHTQSNRPSGASSSGAGSRHSSTGVAGSSGSSSNNNSSSGGSDGGSSGLLQTPALFMIGDKDLMKSRTEDLATCFHEPVVIRHSRGHVVPQLPSEQREVLRQFVQRHSQQQQRPCHVTEEPLQVADVYA